MQKLVFIISIICTFSCAASAQPQTRTKAKTSVAPAATPAAPNPLREADRLFSHGEDAAHDRQSLAVIEQALVSDPGNYQLLWRMARLSYYVGDDAATDKVRWFERGVGAGQKAIALQPGAVEGHFWLGVCYGGLAEVKGALKALTTVKKIRAEMETVLRLNASYEDGNAYLALGEMDKELPRIFGGSTRRAISYLEQGLKIAPRNMNLKLSLAEAYRDAGRHDEASRQLQEILQMPVNPARSKEQRSVQEKARRLLNK